MGGLFPPPAQPQAASGTLLAVASLNGGSFTGQTVPQNDALLLFTGLASGLYALWGAVNYWNNAGVTDPVNYTLNVAGTVTRNFCQGVAATNAGTGATAQVFQTGATVSAPGTTALGQLSLNAIIGFSTAGNTIAFAWAPSVAGDTMTVRCGWLLLTKVG